MSTTTSLRVAITAVSLALTLTLVTSACGSSDDGDSAPAAQRESATALSVRAEPTPPFWLENYETRGTFPQVSGADSLDLVNQRLREAVRRDQQEFAAAARREPPAPRGSDPGEYSTFPAPHISASTRVVSVLIPVRQLFPGGTDGDRWLSATLEVPSGERVALADLFVKPSAALRTLASAVRRRLEAIDTRVGRCVRRSLRDPINRLGLRPRARNYRHFALTADGLAIGFHQAQIAGPPCGRVSTVVPYAAVRPHLNDLGKELIAGVRRPARTG